MCVCSFFSVVGILEGPFSRIDFRLSIFERRFSRVDFLSADFRETIFSGSILFWSFRFFFVGLIFVVEVCGSRVEKGMGNENVSKRLC